MKRTFVDSNVLIAAARGMGPIHQRAMEILDEPEREFAASVFLRLETLPKAEFNQRTDEADFYRAFFAAVSTWADDLAAIVPAAYE